MNATNLLNLAGHADAVLYLAAKQAATIGDWLAINQLASGLMTILQSAEADDDLRAELRERAGARRADLRQMLHRSCREAEALGFGQTGHESETAAAKKGGNPR